MQLAEDYNTVPRVERSLPQLQQYADALRARTNRYRGPAEQAAATRLLAQQGFDANRLTNEVVGLEIVPTIEDVFHAETGSVEEYLQQVEEATLLAAIQEAQQESVASFESYMEACMTRDWAANKRQLFGLIAPSHLAGPGAGAGGFGGGLGAGAGPLIGRTAAGPALAAPALRLSPKEAAYVEVAKRLAAAGSAPAPGAGLSGLDAVKEFLEACKKHEDKAPGQETLMSTVWALLADILGEARRRGVSPAASPARYADALAAGARAHLERGHAAHVRATIARYKLLAERGPDPDALREVQAYVQVKFRDRGPLDFASPGGMDTSWVQLFYALRSGYGGAAARAAERCGDLLMLAAPGGRLGGGGAGLGGGAGMRALVEEWLAGGCRLPERSAAALSREAERLLRDKNGLRQSPRAPFQALVCALLAGDARSLDALGGVLNSMSMPPILATIEDFMWAKLALVGGGGGGGAGGAGSSAAAAAAGVPSAGVAPLTLADLQSDINRWPSSYYSKQTREPLLYVTVLLLSLQLPAAVRFLWRDDTARHYRLDGLHMGLALQAEGVLAALGGAGTGAPGDAGSSAASDVASMASQYGRKFLAAGDAPTALHYYWLAAAARGGGLAVKAGMLREVLAGGRGGGGGGGLSMLLGGAGPVAAAGGAAAAGRVGGSGGGALAALVPDTEERRRLLESVAYECQTSGQPEEAVELYLAAERPVAALGLINAQMSGAIAAAVEEAGGAAGPTPAADRLERISRSGRAAVERLATARPGGGGGGPGSLPFPPLSPYSVAAPSPAAGVSASGSASALLSSDPAARRELEAFQQLCTVRELLMASKRGRHDVALQKLSELPFIPTERSRSELCARLTAQLHPAVAERLQDVISAAADSIAGRRAALGREAATGLASELAVLTQYANSIAGARLPQAVYRKLAEAQVFLA
ncbi:hypothetical protein GPECTOR_14g190 [Gonium pectorale]|uniref:Nuclear pore protein n=1 Tax=Gonium pectorale TaxID=33097 RepID=A0A150GMB7_GONPE|nr:hypothetical protein GPECTOR_14g190 [Gonium pectorale]|eukprot:KXZ50944.1 hypothetical protein GPECTOR_14g190 [Gonium pectorale]